MLGEVLTRLDLKDGENWKDAERELVRAEEAGEAALAAWARKWGGAMLHRLEEVGTWN